MNHFETRQDAMRGKAMTVCMSREVCVLLYDAIMKLRPEWHDPDPEKGAIKVVMTGSASDREALPPTRLQRQSKEAAGEAIQGRRRSAQDRDRARYVADGL